MPFLFIAAALAALTWLVILILPWQPWRNNLVLPLPPPSDTPPDLSSVTVVIPARNEAALIARTLQALAAQGPGLQVILVDDNSTDGTARAAASVPGLDLRILNGQPLPPGWVGKVWALEQGTRLVGTPHILFIDADIELSTGVVAALLSQMQSGCQMVSVMASLNMHTFWEKLFMPAFIYFFKMLYPFNLANSANRRFAAAAGGCVLIETHALAESGGFEMIKGAVIDDCALAARVKRGGFRLWIGQSREVRSIRSYRGIKDIWEMIARSAYTQLQLSIFWLSLCTLGLVLLFLAPTLALILGDIQTRLLGLAAWGLMSATYLSTLRFYGLSPAWVFLLPLAGWLYLAMTWDSALRFWRGERTRWKGRIYK